MAAREPQVERSRASISLILRCSAKRSLEGRTKHAPHLSYFSTVCSMAPKIERPALSFISIRTRSPKRMKGVVGEPFPMVSMVRISAMQE